MDVAICTKGGSRALRYPRLLSENDEFGTTLTFDNDKDSLEWEPNAALPFDRIETIRTFKQENDVKTWVSFEPVIDPDQVYRLLDATFEFVDLYKVGKINHQEIEKRIDWRKFASEIVRRLELLKKPYYIKEDLRKYL